MKISQWCDFTIINYLFSLIIDVEPSLKKFHINSSNQILKSVGHSKFKGAQNIESYAFTLENLCIFKIVMRIIVSVCLHMMTVSVYLNFCVYIYLRWKKNLEQMSITLYGIFWTKLKNHKWKLNHSPLMRGAEVKIGSCQYGNKRAHTLGRTHIFNTGQCARLWVPIKAQMNYSVKFL